MTVVLGISDWGASQSWSGQIFPTLTNSGSNNIKSVKIRINDPDNVFSGIYIYTGTGGYQGNPDYLCRDQFHPEGYVRFVGSPSGSLPAGATKTFWMWVYVESGAPIQVHTLTTEWQYEIYY